MKFFVKILVVALFILLVATASGANIFQRIFGRGNSTKSGAGASTTATSRPTTTTVRTVPTPTSTARTVPVPAGGSGAACWWTQCSSRCASGATVMGANRCDTGGYKFNCCSG